MIKFERHITISSTEDNIIGILAEECKEFSLSNAQLKSAINKGALWLTRGKYTQRVRKVKKTLQVNDIVHFYYDEKVLSLQPPKASLISDETNYSVWYKPYGTLSQGSKWSDHCTIARWAETTLVPQRPAFIVHRLDRAASGLIIIAHSKKAAQAFSQIFEHHHLEKIYHIIVHGFLPSDINENNGLEITTNIDDKQAKSTFYPLEKNAENQLSLIKVSIETGRKHQIRKHAASVNLPVVGDRLHGDKTIELFDDVRSEEINLQLCAVKLSFTCPFSQQEKNFELPPQLTLSLTEFVKKLA